MLTLACDLPGMGGVTSIVQRAAASQARINEFMDHKNDILSTEPSYPGPEG